MSTQQMNSQITDEIDHLSKQPKQQHVYVTLVPIIRNICWNLDCVMLKEFRPKVDAIDLTTNTRDSDPHPRGS